MKEAFKQLSAALIFLFLILTPQLSASLEEAWENYKVGDYEAAQKILQDLVHAKDDKKNIYDMREALGAEALMRMSQNKYLETSMRKLKDMSTVYESKKFRNPRRLNYYVRTYIEDDSTRHKSLPNLMLAGAFAVPGLLEYLKSDETDVNRRGLAFQALKNIGSRATPVLIEASYGSDEMLLMGVVRLLNTNKDRRAIPALLRLKDVVKTPILLAQVKQALATFGIDETGVAVNALLDEVIRYIKGGDSVDFEIFNASGVLWKWYENMEKVFYVNVLKSEFEFYPILPDSLWPLFKAEIILQHATNLSNLTPDQVGFIQSLKMILHYRIINTINAVVNSETYENDVYGERLSQYLNLLNKRNSVKQWVGVRVYLTALDMTMQHKLFKISAQLLQDLNKFSGSNALNTEVVTYPSLVVKKPLFEAVHHSEKLIRYWGVIAVSETDSFYEEDLSKGVLLNLLNAAREINPNTILLISEMNDQVESLQEQLINMDFFVETVAKSYDALKALNKYPSKDMIVIDGNLRTDSTAMSLIQRIKKEDKAKNLPFIILSNEEDMNKHMVMYQDVASMFVFHNETPMLLREKFTIVRKNLPSKNTWVNSVNLSALRALLKVPMAYLSEGDDTMNSISGLLAGKFNSNEAEILAMQILELYGPRAAGVIPTLMEKMRLEDVDTRYRIQVFKTLFKLSNSSPEIRQKLFSYLIDSEQDPNLLSELSRFISYEFESLTFEEKEAMNKLFYSENFVYEE